VFPARSHKYANCLFLIFCLSFGCRCCARQPLVLLLLLLLAAVPQLSGASSSPAAALSTPQGPAAPADCQLVVQGGDQGGISKATLSCKGGAVTVGGNERALGRFKGSFQGVTWHKACVLSGCLLVVCGHSHATFTDSSIQGVQRLDNVTQMLCIRDDSRVRLQSSLFANNRGRALATDDRAALTVVGSRITGNTAIWRGAGIGVLGNSSLVLDGGSVVAGNTAVDAQGGGLAVMDSASMVVTGRSVVSNNSASNYAGGGIYAGTSAVLRVMDGSRVVGNKATNASGGGVALAGSARALIAGGSQILNNTCSAWSGGGVAVMDNASLVLDGGSVVAGNTAVNTSAGGLVADSNATVVVKGNCSVSHNTAVGYSGGGIQALRFSVVTLQDVRVVGNKAIRGGGGGLRVSGDATVVVEGDSSISTNVADGFNGGGVSVVDNGSFVLRGAGYVASNLALNASGGGLSATDNATVRLLSNATFFNNSAHQFCGGGLHTSGSASVLLRGVRVAGNAATSNGGGGICVADNSSVVVDGESTVVDNVAGRSRGNVSFSGGGLTVIGNGSLVVSGRSLIARNTVANGCGGGLSVEGNGTVVVESGSVVAHNNATNSCGGGICVSASASLRMQASQVSHNLAKNSSGGGVCVDFHATAHIGAKSSLIFNSSPGFNGGGLAVFGNASVVVTEGSIVSQNTAWNASGGGVVVANNGSLVVTNDSAIANNSNSNYCGGGIVVRDSASLVLLGSHVVNNTARSGGGGGICVDHTAVVRVGDASSIIHNSCRNVDGGDGGGVIIKGNASFLLYGGSKVVRNTAFNASGGGLVADGNATLVISGESLVLNNTATNFGGGGLACRGRSKTIITNGSVIANNSAASGGGMSVYENATALVTNGTRIIRNDPVGLPGSGIWMGNTSTVNITGGVVFWHNIPGDLAFGKNVYAQQKSQLVMDGTIIDEEGPISRCSNSVYLTFSDCGVGEYLALGACRCCPPFTFSLTPNTTSYQCQACPAWAVCPGVDVLYPVPGYYHSSPRSVQMHMCPMATTACGANGQCQPGYQGNLCGSCAPGYGITLPLKCSRCMSPAWQLGVYMALSIVAVLFVAGTVHFTWKDNLQGGKHLRPSDIIKVLVQFLQYMIILGSISAPWPPQLRRLFSAAAVVFGASVGQAVSLDCWLSYYAPTSSPPQAIKRELVVYLTPVAIFVMIVLGKLLLWAVRYGLSKCACRSRTGRGGHAPEMLVVRQMPVIALVVTYYAYPTLVKASLSFFACLPIDDASKEPYPEYAIRNHTSGYYVGDMEQACFAGWHKAWAFGLGLPATLLLCVGVPMALFWGLLLNKAKCGEVSFREHFGFLYRNYTDEKVWWEAVWALQTVLLSSISTFHFTIKAYYSVILLSLVFLLGAVLQALAQPCAEPRLHHMQLASTACLFLTSFWTLSLFTLHNDAVAEAVPIAVTVVLVCLNGTFVIWCVYNIVRCASGSFQMFCSRLGAACKR